MISDALPFRARSPPISRWLAVLKQVARVDGSFQLNRATKVYDQETNVSPIDTSKYRHKSLEADFGMSTHCSRPKKRGSGPHACLHRHEGRVSPGQDVVGF